MVLHFNMTENPTAEWTAQQILEALRWDSLPKYPLRDLDAIGGGAMQIRLYDMWVGQVLSTPRSLAELSRGAT